MNGLWERGKAVAIGRGGTVAWERRLVKGGKREKEELPPGASYLPLSLASYFVLFQDEISLCCDPPVSAS